MFNMDLTLSSVTTVAESSAKKWDLSMPHKSQLFLDILTEFPKKLKQVEMRIPSSNCTLRSF